MTTYPERIDMCGMWELRAEHETTWRLVPVPGCWEQAGVPKNIAGPFFYRTRVDIPAEWAGRRLWLHVGGASYHCVASVNGRVVGEHVGMWDAFVFEVTAAVQPGAAAEVVLRVEKPASLSEGPASPPLPGRFPLKQTLAGFLPYVWGHTFGGLWQRVELVATGADAFSSVSVRGDAEGRVHVEADHGRPGAIELAIHDPDGALVYASAFTSDGQFRHDITLEHARHWSPAQPERYTATLRLADGDERVVRFGLRTLHAEGSTLTLNGAPIYPRLALSWGWYPEALHSNPGRERVRADMLKFQALGFNGIKLCLWFPPQYYFELADELGMLLWVELPMWLPDPTPFFREQTPREYERLVRIARDHPAVILYTLGCELNRSIGADMLGPLFEQVKALAGDALVRDNSGSGEAYGGLLREFAEFYDYHFYSELPFFQPLLDTFSPRWRPELPWVFGEFCDYDTFRDLAMLGDEPWWVSPDPEINPQGARWQYDVPFQNERLGARGMLGRAAEFARLSHEHGMLHRKWTLELVRMYREIGGYVVTGEADTPITTAGMWDDMGRLKFEPATFRSFNADTVVLLGWDKRRAWSGGGDRAAFWDTWCYAAGALIRPHVVLSHYGQHAGAAHVHWEAFFPGEPPFAAGEAGSAMPVTPGVVRELAVAEFHAPAVEAPRRAMFSAVVRLGSAEARNEWPLWVFPPNPWAKVGGVALLDPAGRLGEFGRLLPVSRDFAQRRPGDVVVASMWTDELDMFLRAGGRAVLLQAGEGAPGPLPTVELPFWREAVRVCEPHPAWGDFPHEGWAGLQLFGCAPAYALDGSGHEIRPILRRIDTRTISVHEYACELAWGEGRIITTTLRFEGGQGTQPSGLARNIAAAYLLCCWVRYQCGLPGESP